MTSNREYLFCVWRKTKRQILVSSVSGKSPIHLDWLLPLRWVFNLWSNSVYFNESR